MRAGELAALNWDEVNLEKKRIHVRRTLTKDGKLAPPKSRKSVRFVKLTDSLVQQLRKWKAEQKQKYGRYLTFFAHYQERPESTSTSAAIFTPAS